MSERYSDLRLYLALGVAWLLLCLIVQQVGEGLRRQHQETRLQLADVKQRVENLEAGYSSTGMTLREQVAENARRLEVNRLRLETLLRSGRR